MDKVSLNGEFLESEDLQLELEPGQMIDKRYRVQRKLGSGATASVYKCTDTLLGNLEVAIKIFKYNRHLNSDLVSRLSREIWASFGIDNGHVARFYECIRNDDMLGLVMEFIDGHTLEDYLIKKGTLSPEQVKYVMKRLCSGVNAMHEKGVLHRDLKPANVMVSNIGGIVITDLGLAKNAPMLSSNIKMKDSASQHIYSELSRGMDAITSHGDVVGTPLYLAPEYLLEGKADISCDIYALGIIAYELIVGEAPFDGEPLYNFLIMKVKEDPVAPHRLVPTCPKDLSDLIMKAIHRDPRQRFANVAEFEREIEMLRINSVAITTYDDSYQYVPAYEKKNPKDNVPNGWSDLFSFFKGTLLFVFLVGIVILFFALVSGPAPLAHLLNGDINGVWLGMKSLLSIK